MPTGTSGMPTPSGLPVEPSGLATDLSRLWSDLSGLGRTCQDWSRTYQDWGRTYQDWRADLSGLGSDLSPPRHQIFTNRVAMGSLRVSGAHPLHRIAAQINLEGCLGPGTVFAMALLVCQGASGGNQEAENRISTKC